MTRRSPTRTPWPCPVTSRTPASSPSTGTGTPPSSTRAPAPTPTRPPTSSAAYSLPTAPSATRTGHHSAGGNKVVSRGPGAVRMGLGEAAVQRDGAAGHGRPPAPHGGEPGDREPGNDDDGHEVDDAEDSDVAAARHQERPAHGDDIQGDDQEAVRQPEAVGEVVGSEFHADRATDHRGEQGHGDHYTDRRERRHHPFPPLRRLERDDGQRDEHRQHNKRDQQVRPERDVADLTRHMALEPQPDERLDELVGAEQQGDRRQREELAALVDVADRVDADRADDQAADDVSLRREAHLFPSPAFLPRLSFPGPRAPLRHGAAAESCQVHDRTPRRYTAWMVIAVHAPTWM